jgi:hypothetical protein
MGPSPDDDKGCFIEPIPEFALFNPISLTRWGTHIDIRTFPRPTNSKPIQNANLQDSGDPDFDVSDSEDEGPTIRLQQELTSRYDPIQTDSTLEDSAMKFLRWSVPDARNLPIIINRLDSCSNRLGG